MISVTKFLFAENYFGDTLRHINAFTDGDKILIGNTALTYKVL